MCDPGITADWNVDGRSFLSCLCSLPFFFLPFVYVYSVLFFLPRNKITLTVCNKAQQNACYIYIYILYAYYILLLMSITKTKSLL